MNLKLKVSANVDFV